MIKKIVFVQVIFLSFCLSTFAQEAANISIPEPELLWQKEFNTPINSVAISSDGTRIAITVDPVIQSVKDERQFFGEKLSWIRGSKLYYLDDGGNTLWEYEHIEREPKKGEYREDEIISLDGIKLKDVVMSNDGKYIACKMELLYTEPYPPVRKGVEMRQETIGIRILFFNPTGTLLWSFKASGTPKILSDGKYVFVVPDNTEEGDPWDNFYFLNTEGKKLWEVPGISHPYTAKISRNGNYIAIGDTLYDKNKNVLWKWESKVGYFTEIYEESLIGIVKEPYFHGAWRKFYCVDLKQKRTLLEIKPQKIEDPPYSPFYIKPFTHYFIDESRKHLVTLMDEPIPERFQKQSRFKKGEVKIYDLNTGKVVKQSLDPSDYYEYLNLYQENKQNRKYRVKVEGKTIYYYEK